MKRQNMVIVGGSMVAVSIGFAILIGPSFNRLFINDDVAQSSAVGSPTISLSIDKLEVNKTSDSTAQVRTTFVAYNHGKNTAILDNIQYSIFAENNTKIASGSIGVQTDDVIQGQASVYPLLAGNVLKVSDKQTLTKSTINNDTLWQGIVSGNVSYVIRGIYTMRDNSYLQAQGVEKDFDITYSANHSNNQISSGVTLAKSILLSDVWGRIDHMSIDIAEKRLFIAELGNNSVDVVDLTSGQRVHTITGLNEPQGVIFIPKLNKLFVSNGGDGTVGVYNATSYSLIKSTKIGSDADNIRYDNRTGLVYVGYGDGALAVLDGRNDSQVANISLPGHPESFQIEESGNRIFVNVPTDHSIILVDKQTNTILKKWQLSKDAAQNFPMALDERDHRLFVGFRDPARLVVYDTESGKPVSSLDISKDVDDIFYDSSNRQVYLSAGEGFLDIIRQLDTDHYNVLDIVNTAQGARTSLFVPELHSLYVAVPQGTQNQEAELLIYRIE